MKRLTFLIALLAWGLGLSAQSFSKGIHYQTIVRDAHGIVKDKDITVTIDILSKSNVFREIHHVKTNEYGLINLIIGSVEKTAFEEIPWDYGGTSMHISMDFGNGPVDFGSRPLVAVPFALNVPDLTTGDIRNIHESDASNGDILIYDDGEWIVSAMPDGDNWGAQKVQSTNTLDGDGTHGNLLKIAQQGAQHGQVLKWDETKKTWRPASDLDHQNLTLTGYDLYIENTNNPITLPKQTLSLSGNNLSISDGNSVTLPIKDGDITAVNAGTGLSGGGTSGAVTLSAQTGTALWNAKKLQGIEITNKTPTDGQSLFYNKSQNKWVNGNTAAETGWIKEFIGIPTDGYYRNYTDLETKIDNSLQVDRRITCTGITSNKFNGISGVNSANYFRDKTIIGPGSGYAALAVTGGSDASATDITSGVLSVGNVNGQHLLMDGNEIMAKGSGSSAGTLFLQVDGGKVRIGGNQYPTHIFQVSDVARSTQSTWATSSDKRVKENIKTLHHNLAQILALRPVEFDWKKNYEGNSGHKSGFIAQEVEDIIPEMVSQVTEEYDGKKLEDFRVLNVDPLFPRLVGAIQELSGELEEQKAKVNQQQKTIDQLLLRVKALEAHK